MISKAERTRALIIERSAPLFNRNGYAATSLSDIADSTGLTKGSIYGNFEDKNAVAIAAFKYNVQGLKERLAEAMGPYDTAKEKLEAFCNYYRDNWKKVFERGGCPILNAAVEADDHLPFMKNIVRQSIKSWVKTIVEVVESGQLSGEISKGKDAEAFAWSMITVLEGGIMLAKIMNKETLLFAALDRMEKMIAEDLYA